MDKNLIQFKKSEEITLLVVVITLLIFVSNNLSFSVNLVLSDIRFYESSQVITGVTEEIPGIGKEAIEQFRNFNNVNWFKGGKAIENIEKIKHIDNTFRFFILITFILIILHFFNFNEKRNKTQIEYMSFSLKNIITFLLVTSIFVWFLSDFGLIIRLPIFFHKAFFYVFGIIFFVLALLYLLSSTREKLIGKIRIERIFK